MKRLTLFVLVAVLMAGCESKSEKLFQSIWRSSPPSSLQITKTLRGGGSSFALFAQISKNDFALFKRTSNEFMSWYPVLDGMSFEIGKITLHAPSEISGVYSVGAAKNGLVRVVVWNEKSETLVVMLTTGIM